MSDADPGSKKRPFGLSPWFLAAIAVIAMVVGLAGGVVLDLLVHGTPTQAPPAYVAVPKRDVPPPIVRFVDEDDPDAPQPDTSILANRPAPAKSPAKTETPPSPPPIATPAPVTTPAVPPPPPKPEPKPEAKPAPKPESKAAPTVVPPESSGAPGIVAIVIDDMGLDRIRSNIVLSLPGPLTVSLMTYAGGLPGLAMRAREAGHEVMAHVPMEPMNSKEKAGPNALTVAMNEDTIRAAVAAQLDHWKSYVGVNNHMGSRFTVDRERMAIVMEELKARGLVWLDSRTSNDSVGLAVAREVGVPSVGRDIFLDNVSTEAAVAEQLERLIAIAKSRGSAVAIGHPHDATIAVLKKALPTLADRGVVLVPITEVVKRQSGHNRPS